MSTLWGYLSDQCNGVSVCCFYRRFIILFPLDLLCFILKKLQFVKQANSDPDHQNFCTDIYPPYHWLFTTVSKTTCNLQQGLTATDKTWTWLNIESLQLVTHSSQLPCFPDSRPMYDYNNCDLFIILPVFPLVRFCLWYGIVICDDHVEVTSEFYHSANFSLSTHAVIGTLQMQLMA